MVNGSGSFFTLPMWALIVAQLTLTSLCRLIIAGCVAVPVVAYLWRRVRASNSASNAVGEHRGANQEYKESAEGNR